MPYYRTADGGLVKVEGTGSAVPPGSAELTEDQYNTQLAAIVAANDAIQAAAEAERKAALAADFDARVAAAVAKALGKGE